MQGLRVLILYIVQHFRIEEQENAVLLKCFSSVSLSHIWKSFPHFVLGYESLVHVLTISIRKERWKLALVSSVRLYSMSWITLKEASSEFGLQPCLFNEAYIFIQLVSCFVNFSRRSNDGAFHIEDETQKLFEGRKSQGNNYFLCNLIYYVPTVAAIFVLWCSDIM